MDFHSLQQKLFQIEPTDPAKDKAKMIAALQGQAPQVQQQSNVVQESVNVEKGSMPLDKDYSVNDFAKLAGITLNENQKMGSSGQAKGKDPMPSTSTPSSSGEQAHPLKDKLVGETSDDDPLNLSKLAQGVKSLDVSDNSAMLVGTALKRAVQGEQLQPAMQDALRPYVELFATIIENPALRTRLKAMDRLLKSTDTDTTLGYNDSEKSKEEESIKERLFRELSKRKG